MIPVQQPQGQPFPAGPPPQGNAQPPVTIDAVVQLLRDDRMRGFRIDIETDSLVESDQKQERADATELVTAIGGFFKEFGPIVQAMPPLAPMASGLLQFAVRRYKVGAELEELIEKTMGDVQQHLANPAPKPPDPVEAAKLEIAKTKGQAEIAKANLGVQQEQVKTKATQDHAAQAANHANEEASRKAALHELEVEAKRIAHEHDMNARQLEMDRAEQLHNLQIDKLHHEAKIKTDSASHDASLKERATGKVAEKEIHSDNHAKLEKMFKELSKALTAKKKIVRDSKGEIIGLDSEK